MTAVLTALALSQLSPASRDLIAAACLIVLRSQTILNAIWDDAVWSRAGAKSYFEILFSARYKRC